jgi:hypothetical protein
MPNHTYKDDVALAYDANKSRLRVEGKILLASAMNEALHEMTTQFNEALAHGEILEIGGSKEELKALLLKAAQRELSPGGN